MAQRSANGRLDTERHSWGRYPKIGQQRVVRLTSPVSADDLRFDGATVLPYGLGRSYGDSCLNEGGVLLDTSSLRSILSFDDVAGTLKAEAAATLAGILDLVVPRGWFLPTSPGTKFVTLAGAIANDVHGKNHHVAGTMGRHVRRFELLRSDGTRLLCSPTENGDMYRATIGGLGLTGLILWAEIQLRPISGPFIDMESIRYDSLDEFFDVSAESDRICEFTVAWIDCMATGKQVGRGLYMRGNHAWQPHIPGKKARSKSWLSVPIELPGALIPNGITARVFNELYYRRQLLKRVRRTVPYDPFFYPLDAIGDWNRLYGERGFLQHQCVVPHDASRRALRLILQATSQAGEGSFLGVLKAFGDIPSPGMMSFPRPGTTLTLDFPFRGERTLRLLDRLDAIVLEHGGAIYPAKDARMSPACFEASFPQWREFAEFVDERFSSSFWRRVTASDGGAAR
jgi:FAD/FMN-containing dehydrogenase